MTGNSAVPPPKRSSSYKQILLTLLFSFLLAGGTCFGFLSTFSVNKTSTLSTVCAVGFLICVVTFLASLLSLVIKVLRDLFRAGRGPQ